MVEVRITRSTVVNGKTAKPGAIVSVSEKDAVFLVAIGKATKEIEAPAIEDAQEEKPKAKRGKKNKVVEEKELLTR